MCERVIFFLPFASNNDVIAGMSDWENSDLKSWLNSSSKNEYVFYCGDYRGTVSDSITVKGGFLCENNFSIEEIKLIYAEKGILLPSTNELSALKTAERRKKPTAFAAERDNSRFLQLRKHCWYWTRTPISTNTSSVTVVTSSGGYYKTLANDSLVGVCPCTYLTTIEVTTVAGDGSINNPFVLEGGE